MIGMNSALPVHVILNRRKQKAAGQRPLHCLLEDELSFAFKAFKRNILTRLEHVKYPLQGPKRIHSQTHTLP